MSFLMPKPKQQYFSLGGLPLIGGKIYTFAAGTSTPKATTTETGAAQTNPIILNTRGEPTNAIFWDGAYKVEVRDALNNLIYTVDNYQTPLMATDLVAATGAGVVGFVYNNVYAAGSVGKWLQNLATTVGAGFIGFIQSFAGAVLTTTQAKLAENFSVFDFMTNAERADALSGAQALDHTASIQAAINWGVANGGNLIFPFAKYNVTSLQVKDAVQTFSMTMQNPIIFGSSGVVKNGIIEIINCVEFSILGACTLHAQDKPAYNAALYIKAQAGTSQATTRLNIHDVTVRNAKVAFNVGEYNVDYQCSEISFFGCNSFACPIGITGGGSQSGASFVGCNIVSEANATLGGTLKAMVLEGGFWYVVGGEIVQTSAAAGNLAIEIRPCSSATYGNPYAILKVANTHIESSGLLLYLNNVRALAAPYSLLSSIAFSNVSGYVASPGAADIIDTTGDNTYAGKIVLDNGCCFYGNTGVTRAGPHLFLGTNTVIDLDGTPFGQSFLQGLSALSSSFPGKPRLRGETILAVSAAITTIATASSTIVNFPTGLGTNDAGYGLINYVAGSYTAPQAMKDVQVSFQVNFATAAANADVWVAVNGAATGFYAPSVSSTIRGGTYVIPALAAGDVVTIRANTNTGASIALSGGASNFLRINART